MIAATAKPGQPFSLKQWLTTSGKARDLTIVFFVVFGVLCFRRWDSFFHPQLWSEDGTNFLWGYETNGVSSLLFPIDQYVFLVPHIVAVFFGVLSVNLLYIPACYNWSCFLITFFVAAQLWKSADYMNIRYKVLYATCFLLVPVGPDMFMNLANIQWFTLLYIVDYIFVGYKYGNQFIKIALVTLFAFTGPFGIILSPVVGLVILIEWKKLTRDQVIAYALVMIAGIIALVTTMQTNIRHRSTLQVNPLFALPPEDMHFLKMIIHNTGDIIFLNTGNLAHLIPPGANAVISLVVFAAIMALTVISYIRLSIPRKYVLLLVAILAFASYVAAFWPKESRLTAFICSRYYFVPFTCMAWLFILTWNKAIRAWHVALYVLFFFMHGRASHVRNKLYDKHWRQQVLDYYEGKTDSIEINEGGPGWGRQVILPHHSKK